MLGRNATVSLCMIVRDEEHQLRECLAPLADLFDEIVIVDTGSRDRTRQIAAEFTSRVIEFPWCDDFAAARNEMLRHATGDWIFWMDADDRMRPSEIAKLRAVLDALDDRPRAFMMETICSTGSSLSCTVTHTRLFRRHPQLAWQGRVHEQLRPEPISLGHEWVWSDVEIDHIGYDNAVLRERKLRRKLRLLKMDYAVDPDNLSTVMHLGLAQLRSGTTAEAKRHFLRLFELVSPEAPFMRRVFGGLAEIGLLEGNFADVRRWVETGLRYFPGDEGLLFSLAMACYALEQYAAVRDILNRIIHSEPERVLQIGGLCDLRTKLAPRMLGAVERMNRNYGTAEAILVEVVRRFPEDAGAWYNLGLVYLDSGAAGKLEQVIARLAACPDGKTDASSLQALWHLRRNELAIAGPIIDALVASAPQLPCPRMLRAEWLSRSRAPMAAQVAALRDVLRVHPGNAEAQRWLQKAEEALSALPAAAVVPAATLIRVPVVAEVVEPSTVPAEAWSTSVIMVPGNP